jgi:hypothetical protein
MGLHQIKEFLHIKRNNHQTQETKHGMGEKPFQVIHQD